MNPINFPATHSPPTLYGRRWLITIDPAGQEQTLSIPPEACVLTPEQIIHAISEPGGLFHKKHLPKLLTAIANRLAA